MTTPCRAARYIAKVSEKSRTPIVPSIIVGVLAMLILLVNVRQTKIFTVVTGVAIVMIYLAYLCVTTPLLLRRIGGLGRAEGDGPGSSRSAGPASLVNALAVAYGALMAINIGWPRTEIYGAGNYRWGGIIFIVGVIAVGAIYYAAVGRNNIGVLDTHSIDAAEAELAPQAFGGP